MIGDVQLVVQPIKYNPGLWMCSWLVSGPLVMDEQPFHQHNDQENSLPLRYSTTHCFEFLVNPFTPESDQCQISPPAPPEILHHTVWRTWLFISYSDEKWLYYKFSLHHSYSRFLKGWENTLFELRSERVKSLPQQTDGYCNQHMHAQLCRADIV